MSTLALSIISVFVWFVILLIVRSATHLKPCALCGSVVATWATLLALGWSGRYPVDPVVVAILMGATAHGILTKLETHAPASWHLFRLPTFLTLSIAAFASIAGLRAFNPVVIELLVGAWTVFALAFAYRRVPVIHRLTSRLLACCRDW